MASTSSLVFGAIESIRRLLRNYLCKRQVSLFSKQANYTSWLSYACSIRAFKDVPSLLNLAMMHAVRMALSLAVLLPVRADDWQVRQCITHDDGELRQLLPQFLRNASSCARSKLAFGTIMCAERRIPREHRALFSPLIETIEDWEQYFQLDLQSAFVRYSDAKPRPELDRWTAYDRLLDLWTVTGELCFYTSVPSLADRIHPQKAGLLTLFYRTDTVRHQGQSLSYDIRQTLRNLRPPSLKIGGYGWKYEGAVACAAQLGAERELQVTAIKEMIQRAAEESHTEESRQRIALYYRDHFSTDSFLQAVVTGWRDTYVCPRGLDCQPTMAKGMPFLPAETHSYLQRLYYLLQMQSGVCIVLKRTATLVSDRYYVAVTTPVLD
ncbi:hypothetical protein L249_3755 [Ophiocordyceps polyrhachis-furcata BCC 54312]|uniref:Uncharacterized protein n=1 Tax=Ophiocordyceps polyrhachis-furcata BCC 54312 TaxID=1330021 RepID=A0A367L4U3_9HYPO|nr:hypothetical protein L249_3755 [Ophiocordyceps polyrhachis-furcata BCC 54312]